MNDEQNPHRETDAADAGQACFCCGHSFVCDLARGRDHCWCMKLPAVLPVRADAKCMCEDCLRQAINNVQQQSERIGRVNSDSDVRCRPDPSKLPR